MKVKGDSVTLLYHHARKMYGGCGGIASSIQVTLPLEEEAVMPIG
jgi:hypothetical protein